MPFAAGIVAAALLAAAPSPPTASHTDAAIAASAAKVLADGGYQRALPRQEAPRAMEPPAWLVRWLRDFPRLGLVLRILAVLAAGALVSLAGGWLVRRLRPGVADVAAAPAPAPDGAAAIPFASAEALAAAGRHGEAIHALLLDTLAALSRAARLAPSLTSREIVARVALPARARDALAGLVAAVEVSRFGGAAPGPEDYRACLERFHVFLACYRGEA